MAGQRKRVSKTSQGTAKGARKSPMTYTWKILNGKGCYQSMRKNELAGKA